MHLFRQQLCSNLRCVLHEFSLICQLSLGSVVYTMHCHKHPFLAALSIVSQDSSSVSCIMCLLVATAWVAIAVSALFSLFGTATATVCSN